MANRLAAESSAYLRQHHQNPVDWYAWGEEPWRIARELNRPVLVSIGYSSCHWCHVMERECFEDDLIASQMNERLVCIKVDREERPDVDQIYMDALMRMQGQGGWPLNVFCAPDGRPFFGGTYFPPRRSAGRAGWPEVVEAVAQAWRDQPGEVDDQAKRVMDAIAQRPDVEESGAPGVRTLAALVAELMERADVVHGGFGKAPKFPTPTNLEAILALAALPAAFSEADLRPLAQSAMWQLGHTLRSMARGGIYDQLGGGFHRYSVDEQWAVPHFEKMLYDNGQLLRVYAETYRQTGDAELVWPITETVEWLEREMRAPVGSFFASQDADSEGEEGRYYVWDAAAIGAVLDEPNATAFCSAFGVTPSGNFERTGKSVLAATPAQREWSAVERGALLEARGARVAPDTDKKAVASWIGYTIGGLSTAAAALERDDWVEAASRAADFVLSSLSRGGAGLMRIWNGHEAKVPAFLDDHAALVCGLLDLVRAGGSPRYVDAALRLADGIVDRFYDPETRDVFFSPSGDNTLVFRPSTDSDGATPSAQGLAVLALLRAAELTGKEKYREVVDAVLVTNGPLAAHAPTHLPTLVRAAALREAGLGIAIILGTPDDPAARALARRARSLLAPDDAVVFVEPGAPPGWLDPAWLEGRTRVDDRATAYVCRGQTCSLPAIEPDGIEIV